MRRVAARMTPLYFCCSAQAMWDRCWAWVQVVKVCTGKTIPIPAVPRGRHNRPL